MVARWFTPPRLSRSSARSPSPPWPPRLARPSTPLTRHVDSASLRTGRSPWPWTRSRRAAIRQPSRRSTRRFAPIPRAARISISCWLTATRNWRTPRRPRRSLRAGLRVYPGAPLLERALGQLLFRIKFDSSEAGTLLARAAKMMPRDAQARHYYAQWAYLNARERICVDQERAALALPGLNDLAALQMNTLLGMCYSRLLQEDGSGARCPPGVSAGQRHQPPPGGVRSRGRVPVCPVPGALRRRRGGAGHRRRDPAAAFPGSAQHAWRRRSITTAAVTARGPLPRPSSRCRPTATTSTASAPPTC